MVNCIALILVLDVGCVFLLVYGIVNSVMFILLSVIYETPWYFIIFLSLAKSCFESPNKLSSDCK